MRDKQERHERERHDKEQERKRHERHNNKLELHEALAPKNVHLFEKCK